MSLSAEYIDSLCTELSNKYLVSFEELKTNIINLGLIGTANEYGYNISEYKYSKVAGRLMIESNRQVVPSSFKNAMKILKNNKSGIKSMIWRFIKWNSKRIDKEIKSMKHIDDDFYDFFSGSMMCNFFCKKINGKVVEVPLYVFMRCAIQAFHRSGIKKVIEAFHLYASGKATPPTPFMTNACTIKSQLASCFLLNMDDTMYSILETLKEAGLISADVGGIGVCMTRIRHNTIRDGGFSQGVIPICVALGDHMRLCNQGSIRKGAATATLACWHYDLEDFIVVTKKGGDRNTTAPDINNAIWMNRLFYDRVQDGKHWTLFCPSVVPDLIDLYGDAFNKRYEEYENDPTITRKKIVDARHIQDLISDTKIENGMPYIMSADSINEKSNQKHRGIIEQTNLCTEIVQFTKPGEPAVCNLHSLNLYANWKKVYTGDFLESYDFKDLGYAASFTTEILNNVFKETYYPLDIIDKDGKVLKKRSINKAAHIDRPIGLGVAGFSDVIQQMELPMESLETKRFNKMSASCIYWNSWAKSVELAIKYGKHSKFDGSPMSQGKLQFDLWLDSYNNRYKNLTRTEMEKKNPFVKIEDFIPVEPTEWKQEPYLLPNGDKIQPTYDDLKRVIMKYGTRNSLITSNMPTATSASARGICETTEAPQSNFYSRKLTAGSFPMINQYLQTKMNDIGFWNADIINYMKENKGSIKDYHIYLQLDENNKLSKDIIERVKFLEEIFKTSFELRPSKMIDLNADRSIYIDQAVSMNHYIDKPTKDKLNKIDFYCFLKDTKAQYYTRLMSNEIIVFTADLTLKDKIKETKLKSMTNKDSICKIVNGKASCCDS